MASDAYLRLREFLDLFPLGFPETESGVELRILERLFTEEEARLAVLLTPLPEAAADFARRSLLKLPDVEPLLEEMAGKGLIFRTRRDGITFYNSAPFMIGLYEYSVRKMDPDLAALFKEYYDTAYLREMGKSDVPGFKVLPVGETITRDTTLLPYMELEDEIRRATSISVADCVCRKEAAMTGHACDHPMEVCLSFGAAAEYYIENGLGRRITAEEAIEILEAADAAGLVHASTNTKHLSNICNCCPCCCASMKGITQQGMEVHRFLNALFRAAVDEELCTGCEACTERCPVGAIAMGDDIAEVNATACLGCGLCAGSCPSEAISLHLREDREEPFDRVLDLGIAILQGKQRNR